MLTLLMTNYSWMSSSWVRHDDAVDGADIDDGKVVSCSTTGRAGSRHDDAVDDADVDVVELTLCSTTGWVRSRHDDAFDVANAVDVKQLSC
eukprot:1000689-Amphidinium_carterae.1